MWVVSSPCKERERNQWSLASLDLDIFARPSYESSDGYGLHGQHCHEDIFEFIKPFSNMNLYQCCSGPSPHGTAVLDTVDRWAVRYSQMIFMHTLWNLSNINTQTYPESNSSKTRGLLPPCVSTQEQIREI